MIDGKTKLLCLLGSPVEHTFSPAMHNASFKKLNINAAYMAFDVQTSQLKQTLEGLKCMQFTGANITIPHKVDVMPFLDHVDKKAQLIGAVNTVVNINDQLHGYNTDVDGFLESFRTNHIELAGKRIAVLGTGGAAKAVVVGLLFENVSSVDVFSRNLSKGTEFISGIHYEERKLTSKTYDQIYLDSQYDVVVNTTPLGMHPHEGESVVDVSVIGHEETVFYDLIYNPLETAFLMNAKKTKRKTINGLEMLIFQGIYALKLWFPEIDIDTHWTKNDVLSVLQEKGIIKLF